MFELTINTIITTVLGLVIGALATALRTLMAKMKQKEDDEEKQYEMLLKATRSLLHDCIYKDCTYHIRKGYIDANALKNIKYLYEPYRTLGGNDICEALYERCLKLEIQYNTVEDHMERTRYNDQLES